MFKHLIRSVLPLLSAGALLAAVPAAAASNSATTTDGNVGFGGEASTEKPQAQSMVRTADAISEYLYRSTDGSYTPGTWMDIVTVPPIGVYRVIILTHWFGYQTGYWEYRAFRGENTSAAVVKLVDSWTYNNPTVPELAWNGSTLHWRWSPLMTNGGPTITVTATDLASDFSPTFH